MLPHMQGHHAHISGTCMQASRLPYVYMECQKLLMDMSFVPVNQYLSKLNASHFGTLNARIANQNMPKKNSQCHAQQEQGQLQ